MMEHWSFIDWDKLVRLSALLSTVIALLALYISWRQQKTNIRLALMDKRLKVFLATRKLFVTVLGEAGIGTDRLIGFRWETQESEFLFGPDISAYLDALYKKAADLDVYEGVSSQGMLNERNEILLWFHHQYGDLKKKFGKYLSLKILDW
jgi:hypothetical protein